MSRTPNRKADFRIALAAMDGAAQAYDGYH